MYDNMNMEYAYIDGKISGRNSAIECICEDIEYLLDRCARDNGEMICRELENLICKYREELV